MSKKSKMAKSSKKKRQQTRWKFTARYANETYIKVGYVYNKSNGHIPDVVRLQIRSVTNYYDMQMTLDEAALIVNGLTRVIAQMLAGQLPIPKETKQDFTWTK